MNPWVRWGVLAVGLLVAMAPMEAAPSKIGGQLVRGDLPTDGWLIEWGSGDAQSCPSGSTSSSAKGRYLLVLNPQCTYQIIVSKGKGAKYSIVARVSEELRQLDLLLPELAVWGRVQGAATGENLTVTADRIDSEVETWIVRGDSPATLPLRTELATATVAPDGTFRLPRLRGDYSVRVTSGSGRSAEIRVGPTEPGIELLLELPPSEKTAWPLSGEATGILLVVLLAVLPFMVRALPVLAVLAKFLKRSPAAMAATVVFYVIFVLGAAAWLALTRDLPLLRIGSTIGVAVLFCLLANLLNRTVSGAAYGSSGTHEWRVLDPSTGLPGARWKEASRRDVYERSYGRGSWEERRKTFGWGILGLTIAAPVLYLAFQKQQPVPWVAILTVAGLMLPIAALGRLLAED